MADKRISQLVDRGTVANNDVVPIVVSGATTTNKATISSIQTFMQGNLDLGVTSVGITLGSSGTDVSVSGSPITSSGNITINLPTASATNRGLLSAADWTTFNNKANAGNYVTLDTTQTITAQKTFTTSGSSDTMIISHGSGSGFALDVLKAGNGEAIRVTKTSGSGNAMTISGGNFEAGTIVKTGGTSSQFLKADGSVDSNTYLTTDTNQSITGFKSFVNGFSLASEGGTNQPTTFINTGSIHEGSASTNQIGFNNSNNIYFGKGLNNGGVLQWTNAAVRYYTLPDADGTIALTTDLSGYLPLTGGTLSNNLFITGGGLQVSGSASANRQVVELYTSSTVSRLAASYVGSSSYGDLELLTGGLARLTIASTGAATFSSSVTAGGKLTISNTGENILFSTLGTSAGFLHWSSAGVDMYLGNESSTGGSIFAGSSSYASVFGNKDNKNLEFFSGGRVLTITSSGAATFSSSVTAASFAASGQISTGNGADADILINVSAAGAATKFASIQSSVSGRNLVLNPTNGGNVGIGTASPDWLLRIEKNTNLASYGTYPAIVVANSDNAGYSAHYLFKGTTNKGGIEYSNGEEILRLQSAGSLLFNTSGTTERMRITSGGSLKASNAGSYLNSTAAYHELRQGVTDTNIAIFTSTAASPYGPKIAFTNSAPNDTTRYFIICEDSTANRFVVFSNGNVVNTNGSYGSISDIKLKENIEDATPKLDDLMKVKVRNYNLIGDDKKQIGVIAQELEEVFPAMIDESEDFEEVEVPQVDEEGNEILNEEGEVVTENKRVSKGTTTKSVKYSVFVPMLIKAMQEQQEQIKELTEQIDSLKNQMQ